MKAGEQLDAKYSASKEHEKREKNTPILKLSKCFCKRRESGELALHPATSATITTSIIRTTTATFRFCSNFIKGNRSSFW